MAKQRMKIPVIDPVSGDAEIKTIAELNKEPNCGTCKAFKRLDDTLGYCTRRPPQFTNPNSQLTAFGPYGRFPVVDRTMYCYEYIQK